MQVENINPDDQIYSVIVLDSASFTPLVKFRDKPRGYRPLQYMLILSHTAALYSADFKRISFFT